MLELTDLRPCANERVGLAHRPLIVGIGSETARAGKSFVTALLVKELARRNNPLISASCETSYPFSQLLLIVRNNQKLLGNMLDDRAQLEILCEELVYGWLYGLVGDRHLVTLQNGVSPFAAWLAVHLPVLLPLLSQYFSCSTPLSPEAVKDLLREPSYTPAARQLITHFGGAILTALSWTKLLSDSSHPQICMIPGVRTLEDCKYISMLGGIVLKVCTNSQAVEERYAEIGTADGKNRLTAPWDTQLPNLPDMQYVPNAYRVGASLDERENAAKETGCAIIKIVDQIENLASSRR